jgi:hypothetical protein
MSRQTTGVAAGGCVGPLGPNESAGKRGVDLGRRLAQVLDLWCCAPGRTRTCGLAIRSRLLYPAELRGRGVSEQPSDGLLPTCT